MKLALIKDGIVKAVVSVEDKEAYIASVAEIENAPEVVEIPEGVSVTFLDTYANGTFTATGEYVKLQEELAKKKSSEEENPKEENSPKFEFKLPKRTPEDFGKQLILTI